MPIGSYGCVPKPVMAHHRALLERVEANPDRWFRSDYRPLQTQQRLRIAAYVKSRDDDLVFVENASAGCNAFLRSFAKTLSVGVSGPARPEIAESGRGASRNCSTPSPSALPCHHRNCGAGRAVLQPSSC